MLLINALTFVPFSILFYRPNYGVNLHSGIAFVASGVLGSLLFRLFFYSGVERVGASRAISIKTSSPLFGAAIAVVFLGESLTLLHLLGIFLIVAGVCVVVREMNVLNSEFSSGSGPSLYLLYPLAAAFFNAVNLPISKFGLMQGTPVIVGVAIKVAMALIILTTYLRAWNKSLLSTFNSPNRKWYILAGVANTIILVLFYTALTMSRVVVVMSPFYALTPLFVLLLLYLCLRRLKSITRLLAFASILVVAGAILITLCA